MPRNHPFRQGLAQRHAFATPQLHRSVGSTTLGSAQGAGKSKFVGVWQCLDEFDGLNTKLTKQCVFFRGNQSEGMAPGYIKMSLKQLFQPLKPALNSKM